MRGWITDVRASYKHIKVCLLKSHRSIQGDYIKAQESATGVRLGMRSALCVTESAVGLIGR
jgi:hypothetical protein